LLWIARRQKGTLARMDASMSHGVTGGTIETGKTSLRSREMNFAAPFQLARPGGQGRAADSS
jgi:hypothetical protein